MKKFLIVLLCLGLMINLAFAELEKSESLHYEIVKKEYMKKGGDFRTGLPPKYTLVVARVFIDGEKATDEEIKESLIQVLQEIQTKDNPDAITIHTFKTKKGAEMAGVYSLAMAEWWPKGHSLSRSNEANIKNKQSYETTFNILERVEVPEDIIVSRFNKEKRKEIYYALIEAEDRASAEAEKKYPTNLNNIPMNQIRDYDFSGMLDKQSRLRDKLIKKYEKQVMKKYKIIEEEVDKISYEAYKDNWPLPDLYY